MRDKHLFSLVMLAAAVASTGWTPAFASTALVTSSAALAPNDTVSWGQLGADNTSISPIFFSAQSDAGLLTFGSSLEASPPDLTVLTQGSSFNGTFTAGTRLLSTGAGNGPLTFSFLSPVSGAGVQIQRNIYGSFIAQISAFDGSGNALQANSFDYQVAGFSFSTGNAPVFMGISSTKADISKIEIQVLPAAGVTSQSFVIGSLALVNPAVSAVPEPASAALCLGGGALLAALRKRRRADD